MADEQAADTNQGVVMPSPDADATQTGEPTTAEAGDVVTPDPAGTAPAKPAAPAEPTAEPQAEAPAPETTTPEPTAEPATEGKPAEDPLPDFEAKPPSRTDAGGDKLQEIKNKALEELRPLVNNLDLSGTDRFQLILKIIRATDDESLVDQAYEAAQKIEDENERAEALVDVVNEIDYFASNKKA